MKAALITAIVLTGLSFICSGCAESISPDAPENSPPPTSGSHGDHGHGHDHPSEGPHHGELIELGGEEYHAELLHDAKAGTVTIYVLDGAAAQTVPIESQEITINATIEGRPQQFKLPARPQEGDPDGMSSRFVAESAELAAHLDEDGTAPQLVLTIKGKSYRGKITHSHDHEYGHAHE
jgi:hypothetical protein